MSLQTQQHAHAPTGVAIELHPLLSQLGSADGLVTLSAVASALRTPPAASLPALEQVLTAYRTEVLVAVEWPAIVQACHHAARHEVRELVALDQALGQQPVLRPLAAASRRVGRSQLQKLRPLRDARVVQRYLEAVENGRAHGWHTLVYGLTVAVYSLPLRQALLGYARQTLGGFVSAAARPLRLTLADCQEVRHRLFEGLAEALESAMQAGMLRPTPPGLQS